ncbi:MAG: EamA family transporter [Clostridia bacterium]|nr:EamA family transporter [Clostridia bacterium]
MKKRALIYIIAAGLLWGTSGIFVHYLSPFGFSPYEMSLVRGTVSFLIMAGYALIFKRSLFRISIKQLLLYIGIGITLFATASCYYSAMQLTSVSTAVVLMYTAPIYVTVISVLFLGEKFSHGKGLAICIMLIGCCFVSGLIGGFKFDIVGILIGIVSGMTYAAYNLLTKIALRGSSNAISATVYAFLFMSLVALIFASPKDVITHSAANPVVTVPLLIGLGIFTFVLPYFLYTLSMRDLFAGTASALGIIEPMAACIFSFALLGEKLDFFSVLGIVLILGAVFLLSLAESKVKDEDDMTANTDVGYKVCATESKNKVR